MPQIALPITVDHPAYAGHFPGQPILPGVVLLDAAQRQIQTRHGLRLSGLAVAKFHSPATPGEILTLDYTLAERTVAFDVRSDTRKIASGQFTIDVDAR